MYTLIWIGVGHNKCTDQVHRSLSGQNASLPAATAGWGRTPRSSRRGGGWVPGLRLRLCTGVGGEGGGVGGGVGGEDRLEGIILVRLRFQDLPSKLRGGQNLILTCTCTMHASNLSSIPIRHEFTKLPRF